MKMKFILFLLLVTYSHFLSAQTARFALRENKETKKIEVLFNDKLVTAYCYWDSTEKPVLFPIKTLSGIVITRGYPIAPRPGERTDHPHQVGLWLNYESVNGIDFWNNSFAIPLEKKPSYGSIRHQSIVSLKNDKDKPQFSTLSHWVTSKGDILLEEVTDFTFTESKGALVIDRTSTLKAMKDQVVFKDVKDGLLGLRLARELEMPSTQEDKFVDSHGAVTTVAAADNKGVTGLYLNRSGIKGDDTWGKRDMWMVMNGMKKGQHISVAIIDHSQNPGFPTYWHARGYGLFAANPLGQSIFSQGQEQFNFALPKGQTGVFRYRIIIHEGKASITPAQLDESMFAFMKQK